MSRFSSTSARPGDNPVVLLKKLVQLFGGSATDNDGLPQLLKKILDAANSAGTGSTPAAAIGATDMGDVSGALQIDANDGEFQIFNATGDIQFTGISNLKAGQRIETRFTNGTAGTVTFTWTVDAADWHRNGSNQIGAGNVATHRFTSFGTTDDDVHVISWNS